MMDANASCGLVPSAPPHDKEYKFRVCTLRRPNRSHAYPGCRRVQPTAASCIAGFMAEGILPIPKHIAIIMDGNGRWAANRGLPRHWGHREGSRAVREVVRGSRALGVSFLTLYAFSLANWARPIVEVTALMRLLVRFARREVAELIEREISVGVIGRPDDLPAVTRKAIDQLIERTQGGQRMRLTLALSYSGRDDLVRTTQLAARLAQEGGIQPETINDAWVRSHLSTKDLPDPDLLIRTGGEQRFSDFLLYESAYAEFYSTPDLWPDFTETQLHQAISWYRGRERRFGRTGAQVRGEMHR